MSGDKGGFHFKKSLSSTGDMKDNFADRNGNHKRSTSEDLFSVANGWWVADRNIGCVKYRMKIIA